MELIYFLTQNPGYTYLLDVFFFLTVWELINIRIELKLCLICQINVINLQLQIKTRQKNQKKINQNISSRKNKYLHEFKFIKKKCNFSKYTSEPNVRAYFKITCNFLV